MDAWGGKRSVRTVDGRKVQCEVTSMIDALCTAEIQSDSDDQVMGMDVIRKLGGVLISEKRVGFGEGRRVMSIQLQSESQKWKERATGNLMSCV